LHSGCAFGGSDWSELFVTSGRYRMSAEQLTEEPLAGAALIHALGLRSQPSGFGDVISGVIFIIASGQVSWRSAPLVVAAIIASACVCVATGSSSSAGLRLGRVDTARAPYLILVNGSTTPAWRGRAPASASWASW
jgi:hypothetical protein